MARLVVFKEPGEIRELHALFYGTFSDQTVALARAKAYQVRGSLPSSVHVTSLLIASLHNDVPQSDLYAIRQAYAMALVRFVNEMLDSQQTGRSVVPLHILAQHVGLPSAFVELRHAATHEDLPSVEYLRMMAHRALVWLNDHYWAAQYRKKSTKSAKGGKGARRGKSSASSGSTGSRAKRQKTVKLEIKEEPMGMWDMPPTVAATVKELLREWRREKRGNSTAVPSIALVKQLETQLALDEEAFVDVCLRRNVMNPTNTVVRRGSPLIALWLPLFERVGGELCTPLATQVAEILAEREWPASSTDARRYTVWEMWGEALAPHFTPTMVQALKRAPRPWNAKMLAIYANAANDKKTFAIAETMAELMDVEIPAFEERRGLKGWEPVRSWTPRPLGI